MSIRYDERNRVFHIQAGDTSYALQIFKSGYLAHIYWGRKLRSSDLSYLLRYGDRAFSSNSDPDDKSYSLETVCMEYPSYGSPDLREPAYQVQLEDGSTISDLRFVSYSISNGKPALKGLPSTYVESDNEAETLRIVLSDSLSGLSVELLYTAYENMNVITRSVHFINKGSAKIKLLRALSACVDFDSSDFDLLQLPGAWARERHINRQGLQPGIQSVESLRGASSHQHNPFIALLGKNTCEDNGDAYGFSFVYSGNFLAEAEVDQYSNTRVLMGINPFDFSWLLEPGEDFQTPEVVMVYSSKGLGDMSRTYHKLYRTRLCRGKYRDMVRPILVNNWEATYFNFNADKIESIAKTGRELGIELMVLDDGWFGKRDSDNNSLGDWYVDTRKLPEGLDNLAERINKLGMKFGLWFEPEMVSPDSNLYRKHPDWCLHVNGRIRSEGRNQLILDLSRKEVCDEVIKMVSDILKSAPISYVKWDMNRHITEAGSAKLPFERQRETAHRYMLGLYYMMDKITSSFPDVLFESCSGGGGRFDPAILYYMPQTWTSDDTDAVERLYIQYGTSIVYPASAMGSHVSAVPNHQVGRVTSLEMRGNVAMSGNLGYELDLTKFSDEEKEEVKKQVSLYKEIRALVQFGDFYRISSPFECNNAAWMFVSESKDEAVAFYFGILGKPNAPYKKIKLKGLDPEKDYELLGTGKVFGGDELMYAGVNIEGWDTDFKTVMWRFKAVK